MLFTIYYESFSFGNDWLGLRTVKLHACVRKCILGQPEKVRAVALAVPLHMDTRAKGCRAGWFRQSGGTPEVVGSISGRGKFPPPVKKTPSPASCPKHCGVRPNS